MMEAKHIDRIAADRLPTIDEMRIISDLRIMHAKVAELSQIVNGLKERHHESDIVKYSDQPVLTKDIQMVDAIYLWFVKVKEESIAQRQGG